MRRPTIAKLALLVVALVPALLMLVQIGSPHWWSIPVSEDPGISWMVVTETADGKGTRYDR